MEKKVAPRKFIDTKFGPFLKKILELWPSDSTNYVNLGPVYAKILSYFPSVTRSDENKMSDIIGNSSRQEVDLRVAFLTVVINHFYYDYTEQDNQSPENSNSNCSNSSHSSDDPDFSGEQCSQDDYEPNNDGGESSSSFSDSDLPSKSKAFSICGKEKKKTDKYTNAFHSLVLGADKAIQYLYPFMSKTQKEVFNSVIITKRIMTDFKTILKDNIAFMESGILPIEKNVKSKCSTNSGDEDAVGSYLNESNDNSLTLVTHTSKKQKK